MTQPAASDEKKPLLEQPDFVVRPVTSGDASAVVTLDTLSVKTCLSATRNEATSLQDTARRIGLSQRQGLVHLVADASAREVARAQTLQSGCMKGGAVAPELGEKLRRSDLPNCCLGYVVVCPYQATRRCYDDTAAVYVVTMPESVLGVELHRSVLDALLDGALSNAILEGSHYRTIVADVSHKEGHPALQCQLDALVGHGFKQVGVLKNVVRKRDLLLDRVMLQKML